MHVCHSDLAATQAPQGEIKSHLSANRLTYRGTWEYYADSRECVCSDKAQANRREEVAGNRRSVPTPYPAIPLLEIGCPNSMENLGPLPEHNG
jgi:hypothetical protein